jgi:hypothetical protein
MPQKGKIMRNPFKRKPAPQPLTPGVFKIGDPVRVKAGMLYPDVPDLDISGWQGRVTDVSGAADDLPVIGLAWDSIALRSLPERFIEQCEEEGLDWPEIYLEAADLECTNRRVVNYEPVKDHAIWFANRG